MLPHITYRQATAQDSAALITLINAAFAIEKGKFKTQERLDDEELEDYFARGVFLVAETSDEPKRELPACVFVEILSAPSQSRSGGVAYFGLLSVAPTHQRQGLGREMTLRAEAWARSQGCHAMELDTLDVRPELPPIYKRMGYRIVSVRPSPVAEWFTQPVNCQDAQKADIELSATLVISMDRREFVTRSASFAGWLSLPGGLRANFSPRGMPSSSARAYDYELCYVPCYGQSLSLGAGGLPAISLNQRFDSLMFAGGAIAQGYSSNLAQDYGSLIPLVENNNNPDFDANLVIYPGETPLSGAFEAIKELMESQDGLTPASITYKLLGSAPGLGGVGIVDLSQGTTPYERLLYEVNAAKSLAAGLGLTFGVPALFWLQGESDACCLSQAQYYSDLQQLFASLNSDVLAVTGQSKPVQFFTYQTAYQGSFPIACAQYELSTTMANVHVASPCYPFQTQGDSTHLTALGYKWLGAYFGAAYKRVVVNGEAWQPLSPKSISAGGAAIVIDFNIAGTALVADGASITTTSPYRAAALGFYLTDAGGTLLNIAGQVAITGPAQITITSPQTVTAGFTVGYGADGGNIRDNYGEQYVFNGGGFNLAMNNWLTVFNYTFPAGA